MPNFDVTPEKRATQRAFMKRQLYVTPPLATRNTVDLQGKTALITGSNVGIGLECARQLLDLASYESVTVFADRARGLERVDILINNAGTSNKDFEINKETGHEQTIQINYLSLALLTILFLPILKEKNTPEHPGRIVIVNSEVAAWPKFKERNSVPLLTAFDKESDFVNQDRYYTSKLLGQLFLSELAKRVPATVAVVNAPNPGLVRSNLYRNYEGTVTGFLFGIFLKIFGRTTSIGARTLTDAAVNHGQASHGQYLEDGKIQPMAPIVYKPDGIQIAQKLWDETMSELSFANVSKIIDDLSAK